MRARKLNGLYLKQDKFEKPSSTLTWGFWLYFALKTCLMAPHLSSSAGIKDGALTEEIREAAGNSDEAVVLKMSYELERLGTL